MPRHSDKQLALKHLSKLIDNTTEQIQMLELLGIEPDSAQLDFVHRCHALKNEIESKRYLRCGTYKKRVPKFDLYLQHESTHRDALKDSEFLFHFRVCRQSFWELVDLIKDHSVFQRSSSDSRGPAPKPASHQLLVLLKYYGSEGNGASSKALGNFFGIGAGAADKYRNNALKALLSLEDRTYFWPTPEERKAISSRIKEKYFFPHCIGLIDGTLLPLASRPLLHGENYLSRKKFYALVMLVVCDDQCRVLYYQVGWPGSVHDNRVWRNSKLYRNSDEMFSPKEYLLGDSAFTPGINMVPPFKSLPGEALDNNKTAFNTLLASPRVKSEHCIGILKGRFPFLRCIRLKLGKRKHLRRIIDNVRGTVILHNFLINEKIEDGWIQHEEEDGEEEIGPESQTRFTQANDTCRSELLYYLSELESTAIN